MKNKKLWFKNKDLGLGWYPATWQGWAIVMVFVLYATVVISAVAITMPTRGSVVFGIVGMIVGLLLMVKISLATGETPHWHWKKTK